MPGPAKRPIDEFLLSLAVFLILPLLPLILELGLTWIFKGNSFRYLEQSSVMISAPMLAAGIALASRYKSIAAFSLIFAICLAVLYGAQAMQVKPTEAQVSAVRTRRAPPVRSLQDGANQPKTGRTFRDKIGLDETPGVVAWCGMGLVSLILILERIYRHIRLAEPLEFEWNK